MSSHKIDDATRETLLHDLTAIFPSVGVSQCHRVLKENDYDFVKTVEVILKATKDEKMERRRARPASVNLGRSRVKKRPSRNSGQNQTGYFQRSCPEVRLSKPSGADRKITRTVTEPVIMNDRNARRSPKPKRKAHRRAGSAPSPQSTPHKKSSTSKNRRGSERRLRKRSNTRVGKLFRFKSASKTPSKFGTKYETIVDYYKTNGNDQLMPTFLHIAINYIETHGVYFEGIFRVSPPQRVLNNLRTTIEQGKPIAFGDEEVDAHAVSGLIKLFLRELPEPLGTFALFEEFTKATKMKENIDGHLRDLVEQLSPPRKILFERLILMAKCVAENSSYNKMSISNLATVLAPNVLYRKESDPLAIVSDAHKAAQTFVLLTENFYTVFC